MLGIRRLGLVFFILLIGIALGTLGAKTALSIVIPLFLLWFMLWDETSYRRHAKREYQKRQSYVYRQ